MSDLEGTFQEARLDSVKNSQEILGVLEGAAPDFDEKLFDALTEVRLARWAWSNGYQEIEKLEAKGTHPTPEFHMGTRGHVALAEAKHLQVRDYLVYFVADRLEGLALVTGKLTSFGLRVETSDEYNRTRGEIVKNRLQWMQKAREELTEDCLSSLEQSLGDNPEVEVQILDGLFVVSRSPTVGPNSVIPALMGRLSPNETAKWCLSRLRDELLAKLRQIRAFMDSTGASANSAIVFFSGIDEWEPEWNELWKTLDGREQWARDCAAMMKAEADKLISMPFELIVGRYRKIGAGHYGSIEYCAFRWHP